MPQNKAFINIVLVLFVLFLGYTACDAPKPEKEEAPQEIVKTPYKFEDERVKVADSLYGRRQYAASLPEFQKAHEAFLAEDHWEGILYTSNQLAITHRRLGHQKEAKEFFEMSKKLVDTHFDGEHLLLAQVHYYETVRHYQLGKYDISAAHVDSAYAFLRNVDQYDSLLLKNIIRYKYYSYFATGQKLDTCIKYLDIRDEIIQNRNIASTSDRIALMGDYVLYYRRVNDLEKAQIYAQRNLSILNEENDRINRDGLYGLYSLATVHFSKSELDRSLELARQMLDTAQYVLSDGDIRWVDFHNFLATTLMRLGEFEESLPSFGKAKRILDANNFRDDAYWQNLQNTAISYSEVGLSKEAETLFKTALSGMQNKYGLLGAQLVHLQVFLGNFYRDLNMNTQSLAYYDSAIRSTLDYESENILELPKIREKVSRRTLQALQGKSLALSALYEENSRSDFLESAIDYVNLADSIITNNRREYEFAEGRIFLADYFKDLYEIGLGATHKLYQQQQSDELVGQALAYMSRSKNVLLLDQSGDYELVMDDGIPESMRKRYFRLQQDLEQIDEELIDLMNNNFTNSKIQQLNISKMNLNNEIRELRSNIENLISTGEMLDGDAHSGTHQAVLEYLERNEKRALVEYFVGDEAIFAVGLDKSRSTFKKMAVDDEHVDLVDDLVNFFNSRPNVDSGQDELSEYGRIASDFYSSILQPVVSELEEGFEELIIVPDEYLSKVPFEALVKNHSGEERSFRDFEYVLRKHKITYMLSSRLIGKSKPRFGNRKRMLGFGFSGNDLGNLRSEYAELPGTTEEINFLKENVPGDYFLGPSASKDAFSTRASKYAILHLAVHGEADLENRYKSRLIFNGESDNILKSNDIYGLGLKADLVVLSACESGVGEISKGEGTFSIARSFVLAGVPAMVVSLWKVDDNVASELMVGFHSNLLSKNTTSSDALHMSKLDYLQNADEYGAHPYYWATFVSLNGDSVINTKKIDYLNYLFFGLALILLILFLYIKKRRST